MWQPCYEDQCQVGFLESYHPSTLSVDCPCIVDCILPRLHLIWTSTQGLLVEPHSPPSHLVSDNTSVNIGDIRDSWGEEHVNIGPLSCVFHSAYLTSAVVVARNAKLRSFGKKRNDAKQSWRLVLLFFLLAFLYLKFSLILHSYILIFQYHLLVLCK